MPSSVHDLVRVALALALGAGLTGCSGQSAPPPVAAAAAPPALPATAAAPLPPTAAPAVRPLPAPPAAPRQAAAGQTQTSPPAPAPADKQPAAVANYKPPFPDRTDLFVPPKRQGGVRLQEGETEASVVLLGFVRVTEPLAVLSVNGEVASIAEGATQYGVEVISIQPPMVVLQRGRQRWQASLEN